MAASFDLVIRRGQVVDGSGADSFEADVAVSQGRIAAIGSSLSRGTEEIDAKGLLVTPGFVDIHTHYDAQVTWANRLAPSSAHGVTTAIMGNCGVGFAPCRPKDHELLLRLMEGVEDIPHPVLAEGLPWSWETFPEYLDFLSGRHFDIDVGAYVPHAPLRVYVMGQRAIDLEPASDDDMARMAAILRKSIAAGGLGIATSRTLVHRSSDGKSIPTLAATERELTSLALALKAEGAGIFQLVGGSQKLGSVNSLGEQQFNSFQLSRRLAERSGRPVTFAMVEANEPPFVVPGLLEHVTQANDAGLVMRPQILPRATGLMLGHQLSLNPFFSTQTYRGLADLAFEERLAQLRHPEIRARILDEATEVDLTKPLSFAVRHFDKMFVLGDPPDYDQPPQASIASRATRLGMRPDALAYDLMLENDATATLYLAMINFPNGSLDRLAPILQHRDVVPGLGDGGAHCATVCDGSYSTFLLTHFVRHRKAANSISLPTAIHKLSRACAQTIGLLDRGLLRVGYKADINVIDFDRLALRAPHLTYDLPSGGLRFLQRAEGYEATIVAGAPVYRNGEATGALPGKLVRGARTSPG